MATPSDHDAIVAVMTAYAAGTDRRDWALFRSLFADPCEFDFSSFNGAPAVTLTPDQWTAGVQAVNGHFDATQHLITNHDICFVGDGEATCVAELRAQHWFSPASMQSFGLSADTIGWCELGGHYANTLTRTNGVWQIRRCCLVVRWRTGNDEVFRLARQRGRERPNAK
jgi:hypothetical protein